MNRIAVACCSDSRRIRRNVCYCTVTSSAVPGSSAITSFGWFANAQFGGLSAVILAAFIYGLAVVLVVLFEPGGAAAIGRRLAASLSRKEQR